MALALIYVPMPSMDTATQLAQNLLEEKSVACANILPGGTSLYQWEGKLEQKDEVILLLKTPKSKSRRVARQIEVQHPYDCPCILTFTATSTNSPFLVWASEVTEEQKR